MAAEELWQVEKTDGSFVHFRVLFPLLVFICTLGLYFMFKVLFLVQETELYKHHHDNNAA